jgi:hypothetical protein
MVNAELSTTDPEVEIHSNEDAADADQLWAAYKTGQSLNHLRWLSETVAIDGRRMFALNGIRQIIIDLSPILNGLVPLSAIDKIESVTESCRVEWDEMIHSQWFSEMIVDAHDDLQVQECDSNPFRVAVLSACSPYKRLRGALLEALSALPTVVESIRLGEKSDQIEHPLDVVQCLLTGILDERPKRSRGNLAPASPRQVGGRRRRGNQVPASLRQLGGRRSIEISSETISCPPSVIGLPVSRNWKNNVLAICRRIGIESVTFDDGQQANREVFDESIRAAFKALDRSGDCVANDRQCIDPALAVESGLHHAANTPSDCQNDPLCSGDTNNSDGPVPDRRDNCSCEEELELQLTGLDRPANTTRRSPGRPPMVVNKRHMRIIEELQADVNSGKRRIQKVIAHLVGCSRSLVSRVKQTALADGRLCEIIHTPLAGL